MKNHSIRHNLKFLATGAIFMFLLAACQTQPVAEQPQTEQPITKEPTAKVEIPGVSTADQVAFDAAINLLDTSFCQKITDAEGIKTCETTVADAKVTADAGKKMDASLCASVSSEDAKKACEIQVDYLKAQKTQEEAFQLENDKVNEVIKGGNLAACQTITDEKMQAGCEFNILINEGSVQGDGAAVCVKASAEETKTRCLEYYEGLPETAEVPDLPKA